MGVGRLRRGSVFIITLIGSWSVLIRAVWSVARASRISGCIVMFFGVIVSVLSSSLRRVVGWMILIVMIGISGLCFFRSVIFFF